MTKLELDQSYVFDAYNQAEHASRLVECARVALEHGDYEEALNCLRQSERPADSATFRIRCAIEQLEKPE